MKIKKTFTEKFMEEQSKNKSQAKPESINWTWLESERPKHHIRKNNDKTIYQPYNECMAKTKGTLIIESGEFILLFSLSHCNAVFLLVFIQQVNHWMKIKQKKEMNFSQ